MGPRERRGTLKEVPRRSGIRLEHDGMTAPLLVELPAEGREGRGRLDATALGPAVAPGGAEPHFKATRSL